MDAVKDHIKINIKVYKYEYQIFIYSRLED